jgi:hypothetical protein
MTPGKRKAIIREILADSREYDADTIHIDLAGLVTAKKDPDKVPGLPREAFLGRYLIGHYNDLITKDGQRREGW